MKNISVILNSLCLFTGRVRLQSGWQPLRLYYRHSGSAMTYLELTCIRDGAEEYKLEPEVFRQAEIIPVN